MGYTVEQAGTAGIGKAQWGCFYIMQDQTRHLINRIPAYLHLSKGKPHQLWKQGSSGFELHFVKIPLAAERKGVEGIFRRPLCCLFRETSFCSRVFSLLGSSQTGPHRIAFICFCNHYMVVIFFSCSDMRGYEPQTTIGKDVPTNLVM